MKLSENLQNLRKQQQLSQEQLAEKLNVSRQSVSKWESGDSYPETDKLIAICELFGCSMDNLVMGEISSTSAKTNSSDSVSVLHQYDQIMNQFSRRISLGVGILMLGVTMMIAIESFFELNQQPASGYDTWGLIVLLCCAAISVPIFIVNALKLANFKLKHPHIEETYPEDTIEAYNSKFIAGIATGVTILILGVTSLVLTQNVDIFPNSSDSLSLAIFMAFATIAVPILVFVSLRRGKYNLAEYNTDAAPTRRKNEILIGKICGTIMLAATIVFLCLGFIFNLWESCWFVYPIGGICCGIVGVILGPEANH